MADDWFNLCPQLDYFKSLYLIKVHLNVVAIKLIIFLIWIFFFLTDCLRNGGGVKNHIKGLFAERWN